MKLRVLGCSGAEFPGHNPSAFLIDDALLLDAGTIGAVLNEEEQWRIRDILISHPHLDHIRSIPALADNIIVSGLDHQVSLVSTGEIIDALRAHLMNGIIWPDFSRIPSETSPVLSYREIVAEEEFRLGEYAVTAYRTNHPVPAVAYRIAKGDTVLVYTGDTGPTERLWERAGRLSALIVEVSFPNDMEQMAFMTGHLTPLLLGYELAKLAVLPDRILITHLKPQYYDRIAAEIALLPIPGIELLREGRVYEL